jgi:hypothetical protein
VPDHQEDPLAMLVEFLFESIFQLVTLVGIAIAIAAIFYFLSKDNSRGVIWSSAALACAVVVMLAIIADRHFVRGAVNRTSSESATAPAVDSNLAPDNLAVEEFRARLSIQQSVMTDDILPGRKPSVIFTITNTGKTAAEKITTVFAASITPVLPRWEASEFDAALVGQGEQTPERDEFLQYHDRAEYLQKHHRAIPSSVGLRKRVVLSRKESSVHAAWKC